MKKIINGICFVFAFIFLGIGAAGAVLPILPTTPFLLAAAFLFGKSSKRFHKWFVGTNLYQKYIEQAIREKAMTKETKRKVLIMLGLLFTIGFFAAPIWHAKVLIAAVAVFHGYYFLFRIRTITTEEAAAKKAAREMEENQPAEAISDHRANTLKETADRQRKMKHSGLPLMEE